MRRPTVWQALLAFGSVALAPKPRSGVALSRPLGDGYFRGVARHEDALRTSNEALRAIFRKRRVLLFGGSVSGLVPYARDLRALGAEPPFIIGSSLGSGVVPNPDEARWCSLEVRAHTVMDARRAYESMLASLPDAVRAEVDAYDPERRAIALGTGVLSELARVGGRPRYGARPRSWSLYEDKILVDTLWEAIGIAHAPYAIVPAVREDLERAAAELDRGSGTVWAGDARDGLSAVGDGLRWVRTSTHSVEAAALLAQRSDRARVMPFLSGIPCSVHGIVFADDVAVFRPLEQITLQCPSESALVCAGDASLWDPGEGERARIRDAARRAGTALAERVGFRGAFTVDGVYTEAGFLPTELNARSGRGLPLLDEAISELPLWLLAITVQAGQALDLDPALAESLVREAAAAHPSTSVDVPLIAEPAPGPEQFALSATGDGYCVEPDAREPDATMAVVASEVGASLTLRPRPGSVPAGPPFSPWAVAALRAVRSLPASVRCLAPMPGVA